MKFSLILSFVPVLAYLSTVVVAAPIAETGSFIASRESDFDLEVRSFLPSEYDLYSRGVISGGKNLLAKIGIGKKKSLTEEQKKAKIAKLEHKLAKTVDKHHADVATVKHGHSGVHIANYHGPEEHRKLAEEKTKQSHKMFSDLHKFKQADVHVQQEPGKLHITTHYHNGPGTAKAPLHMFHHQ